MPESNTYASKAWLLDGPIHSLPGILHLDSNRISYLILEQGTFTESRLKELLEANSVVRDEYTLKSPITLFSISKDQVSKFHIPWYYFGAGGQFQFANRSYRFSFVKPQNTVEPTYYSESFMEWRGGKGQEEVNIAEGKSAGKKWKALLS